ncbi:alpha/beta fold hydrolase [Botrimarina sp.]|uniref:esterase/lipase family protein n=1 Tax=Botrimarina sp. TaxID=2795802 RepID=UPI0032EBEC2A
MPSRFSPLIAVRLALALALLSGGCATTDRWIEQRPPDVSWASRWIWTDDAAKPLSPSTHAAAKSVGVDATDASQRRRLLELLEEQAHSRLAPELEFALCELAAVEAERLAGGKPDEALGFYAESIVHGYRALAADPHTRIAGTTQRYNDSLKALLRLLRRQDKVRPGTIVPLPLTHSACSIAIDLKSSRWTQADFQNFEFACDYQVTGLRNHYHASGVGTPLIAVRYHPDHDHPADRYYPTKLCYPLTAVARAESYEAAPAGGVRLVLELHDTLEHEHFRLAGRDVQLETDLTTPLAYYLDQPELHEQDVSTLGLLSPGRVKQLQGLYLLEPYDARRIPVVMVHGLWSSPATWMEMFNDLRSDPRLRERYQFWFYLYPTGNPFWVTAAQMRSDMAALRRDFDPHRAAPALDQAVLVGHSMGGLVSRLQTVDSGDTFWQTVSDRRFDELDAEDDVRQYLGNLFFFRPNPSVQRVVTIGTPHRGSRFANGVTQWLGAKLIEVPMQTLAAQQDLFRRNKGFFRPEAAARVMTSIDSLSPASPMLSALLAARPGPWVRYHNIIGDVPRSQFTSWYHNRGDGVVSVASARLDDLPQLASQISVPEDHVAVHRHPQAIAEVRRVLLAHLTALEPPGYAAAAPGPRQRPVVRVAGATDSRVADDVVHAMAN